MKLLSCVLSSALFASGISARAQSSAQTQYREAVTAYQRGNATAVVRILEPIAGTGQFQGVELARVWMLLGSSYRLNAEYRQAERAYGVAIQLLRNDSRALKEYEIVLRESGELSRELGDAGLAETLQRRGLKLSERSQDHAAIARACEGLAELALDGKHLKESERYIKRAEDESRLTTEFDEDDRAYLAQLKGGTALKRGEKQDAISDYQQSITLLAGRYGENFALTGWGDILLAESYEQNGETDKALEAARRGLTILERTAGNHDPRYAAAEIRYADILDKTGQHAVAAQLKAQGEAVQRATQQAQCVGCTINVAAFR
jgi:tetratricopeptide (TPR) repeat protein